MTWRPRWVRWEATVKSELLDKLDQKQISGAVRNLIENPEWKVILAIIDRQAEATEQEILTAKDAHRMAYAVGQLNALRQIPKVIETYAVQS